MQRLTERQDLILTYIVQFTLERAYQPSIREICDFAHISSTNGVIDHLKALERKGYLTKAFDAIPTPRSLRLTDAAFRHVTPPPNARLVHIDFEIADAVRAYLAAGRQNSNTEETR